MGRILRGQRTFRQTSAPTACPLPALCDSDFLVLDSSPSRSSSTSSGRCWSRWSRCAPSGAEARTARTWPSVAQLNWQSWRPSPPHCRRPTPCTTAVMIPLPPTFRRRRARAAWDRSIALARRASLQRAASTDAGSARVGRHRRHFHRGRQILWGDPVSRAPRHAPDPRGGRGHRRWHLGRAGSVRSLAPPVAVAVPIRRRPVLRVSIFGIGRCSSWPWSTPAIACRSGPTSSSWWPRLRSRSSPTVRESHSACAAPPEPSRARAVAGGDPRGPVRDVAQLGGLSECRQPGLRAGESPAPAHRARAAAARLAWRQLSRARPLHSSGGHGGRGGRPAGAPDPGAAHTAGRLALGG